MVTFSRPTLAPSPCSGASTVKLIAVVSVGVDRFLEVRDLVEGAGTPPLLMAEVVGIGARQGKGYALFIRVGGRVCVQGSAGTSILWELEVGWSCYNGSFVHVLDGDGDGNGVRQSARVGGGNRLRNAAPGLRGPTLSWYAS